MATFIKERNALLFELATRAKNSPPPSAEQIRAMQHNAALDAILTDDDDELSDGGEGPDFTGLSPLEIEFDYDNDGVANWDDDDDKGTPVVNN